MESSAQVFSSRDSNGAFEGSRSSPAGRLRRALPQVNEFPVSMSEFHAPFEMHAPVWVADKWLGPEDYAERSQSENRR